MIDETQPIQNLISRTVLQKIKFGITRRFPKYVNAMELSTRMTEDTVTGELLFHVEAILLGKVNSHTAEEKVLVPLTWWDFWKEDHAPKWLKAKYPVKYREIITKTIKTENRICPHWQDSPLDTDTCEVIRYTVPNMRMVDFGTDTSDETKYLKSVDKHLGWMNDTETSSEGDNHE